MAKFTLEQQQAIQSLDKNVVVSAGAGAGKTRVLVERYLKIITEERADCGEILAVTFTKKAAKEMKDRIRAEISVLMKTANSEKRIWWRKVKQELEYAPISTMHSLCSRILRENPVEAELDPSFRLLEEIDYILLKEKVVNKVLTKALSDKAAWFEQLMSHYGMNFLTDTLVAVYDLLAAEDRLQDNLAEILLAPYRERASKLDCVKENLREACRGLLAAPPKKKGKNQAKIEQLIAGLESHWNELSQAIDQYPENQQAERVIDWYLGPVTKTISRETVEALAELKQIRRDLQAVEFIPAISEYLLVLHTALSAAKQDLQAVTYNDLELKTVNLLSEHPELCTKYVTKFRFLMVDEFQDTNDLQRQIIYLLAGGDRFSLQGEKLFIVGDPKQSIYRFRGADVGVFEQVAKDIEAKNGRFINLDTNFRSGGDLLYTFNACFSRVIGRHERSCVKYNELKAFHSLLNQACAELLIIDGKDTDDELSKRDGEAELIALRMKQLVEGPELLPDGSKPSYGDMAVLLRAFTDIEAYEAALQRHNIPYYVAEGKGFYERQEVVDLINLLKAVDNSYNEQALFGVLRSPMFMLSDQTIFRLKLAGSSIWQGLEQAKSLDMPQSEKETCLRAFNILHRLISLKGLLPVGVILREALTLTEYCQIVLTQLMGMQKYANIQKFIVAAESFSTREYHTLNDFLHYIDRLTSEVREGEAAVDSEKGETVKIMTIHKSKGLEFPIVFVPDLHRQIKHDSAPALYVSGLGLGLKIPGISKWETTFVYDAVNSENQFLAIEEYKRLLYVAMTRAEKYLVLSGVYKKPGSAEKKELEELNCWLNWLLYLSGQLVDYADIPEVLPIGSGIRVYKNLDFCPLEAEIPLENESFEAEDIIQTLSEQIKPISTVSSEKDFSPTALAKFVQCHRAYYYKYLMNISEFYEEENISGEAKAPAHLVGLAIHKCCELYQEGQDMDACLLEACESQVPAELRQSALTEVRPLFVKYLQSSFYSAMKHLPAKQEWRYRHKFEKHIFTGSVDRLIFYPDGSIGIIDYKSDQVEASEIAERAKTYSWQLVLYAAAVRQILNKPIRYAKLYFLRPEQEFEIKAIFDSKKVLDDILATCDFIVGHDKEEDYAPLPGKPCNFCGYKFFCPDCLTTRA